MTKRDAKDEKKAPKLRFKGFTDDWEQHKISQIADRFDNLRVPVTASKRQKGSTPYYGANGIQDYVNGYTHDGEFLLIAEDGANDIRNYPVNYVNGKVWVNNHAHVIKGKANIANNLFLQYAFKSINIESYLVGGGRAKLTAEVMMRLPIKLPSIEEQNKIGKLVHSLDDTITLHEEKRKQLEQLKKALLQKMFADKTNFPEIRFNGYVGPWEQQKFKDLFVERRDKTVKENEDILLSCAISGIYLNSELFSHFRGSSTIGYLKVKKNDLILSAQNLHLGNVNVNLRFDHGIISPAYKVFEIQNASPYFVQAWMKRDATKNFFLKSTTEGASQCRKNIEWKSLYNQKIRTPSKSEQKKVGELFQFLDRTITLHDQKIEDLKQLKQALLQQMFI